MFFGYLATHFSYDFDRRGDFSRQPFGADYAVRRKKGVCEDYSNVFKELCDRSGIPCLIVHGKVPLGFIPTLKRRLHGVNNKANHAWNVVKMDTVWKSMDPTWSGIRDVKKYYRLDEYNRKIYMGKAKIVDRTYYAPTSNKMKEKHTAIHPAFYLSSDVSTFKSSQKKKSRQENYSSTYDFSSILDSIYTSPYPMLSELFQNECLEYSGLNYLSVVLRIKMNYLTQKTTHRYKPTVADYEQNIRYIKELKSFIYDVYQVDYSFKVLFYEQEIKEKIRRLKRREALYAKNR